MKVRGCVAVVTGAGSGIGAAMAKRFAHEGARAVVVSASAAGLLSQFDAPYAVTKHASVALAEWLSITYGGHGLGVSCLCPAGVDTPPLRAESAQRQALMGERLIGPDEVADVVVRGLESNDFLILPHPEAEPVWQRKTTEHARWLQGMRRFHKRAGS